MVRKKRKEHAHIHKFLCICKSNFTSNVSHHLILALCQLVKIAFLKLTKLFLPRVEDADELEDPRKPDMLYEVDCIGEW